MINPLRAFYVSDHGEQRGPFHRQQIAAMWKQGLLSAEALYLDDKTQEWRNVSEIATPLVTAFKRAIDEVKKAKTVTPEARQRPKKLAKIIAIILSVFGSLIVAGVLYVVSLDPNKPMWFDRFAQKSSTEESKSETSAEYNLGYIDGLAAGRAARATNSAKMGYETRDSVANRHSAPLPPQMNRKKYEDGWSTGYGVGYDNYTK